MKKRDRKVVNLLVASACVVSVVSITGCGGSSKKKAAAAVVQPVSLKSAVTLALLDANTGNPVTSAVTVTVVGADAAKVTDANGNVGPFVLTPSPVGSSITLTSKEELNVVVAANAEGYFSTTSPIALKSNTLETVELKIASKSSVGGSILTTSATTTTDPVTGAIAADLAVDTPVPAAGSVAESVAAGTSADVVIPQNTVMKDANGNVVKGDIKMEVGFFPNDAAGAAPSGESPLNSFPGGLDGVEVAGTTEESGGGFISGGLVAVEIKNENGDQVTTFDKPIDVKTTMSADTVNPDTGLKIQTGDLIPIWSYDEATGVWTKESEATIGAYDAATNTFDASFQATHLSYWNLDWYESERCSSNPIKVSIKDSNGKAIPDNYLKADLRRVGGGWARSVNLSQSELIIYNAPVNVKMNLALNDGASDIYTQEVANLCDLSSVTVPAAAVVPPPSVKVTPKATVVCDNNTGKPIPVPALVYAYTGSYPEAMGKYLSSEYRPSDSTKAYDLAKGKNHFFFAYTTSDVKNGKGEVILPAYSQYDLVNFKPDADQTVDLEFEVDCPSGASGTGGN